MGMSTEPSDELDLEDDLKARLHRELARVDDHLDCIGVAVLERLRDAVGDMDRDELTELGEAAAGLVEAIEKEREANDWVTRHEG